MRNKGFYFLLNKFSINQKLKCLSIIIFFFMQGCTYVKDEEQAAHVYGNKNLFRSAKYNVQLGLGYLEQGDVERAKDKFLKAVKQSPKLPQAHYNLAHFYYLIDDNDLAEQHFKKAIEYSSSNTEGILGTAYNNFGVYLCQTKRYKEAFNNFEYAISDLHYADTSSAYENAGLCALKNDDKKLALDYFSKTLKSNPLSSKSLIELSALSIENKDYNQAKLYLQRYNQVVTPSRRSLVLSLKVAKQLGNKSEIEQLKSLIINKYPDLIGQLDSLEIDDSVDMSFYSNKLNKPKKIVTNYRDSTSIKYTDLGKLNKIT